MTQTKQPPVFPGRFRSRCRDFGSWRCPNLEFGMIGSFLGPEDAYRFAQGDLGHSICPTPGIIEARQRAA